MRRPLAVVLPVITLLVLGVPMLASAASPSPRTVIFNMYPQGLEQPDRVFFQANSGPFLDALQWSGWGTAQAVGTGTWRLDCSNGGSGCGPGDPSLAYPARYVLGDLAPCPRFGAGATSYRAGTVEVDRPEGTTTAQLPSDYDYCAKQPTRTEAGAAVARYVGHRLHGHRVVVVCHPFKGDVAVECKARWRRAGKATKRVFWVSPTMSGRLLVSPLG